MSLTHYREDTRALIRDSRGLFVSDYQLDRWINRARRQAAYRTGCIRVLVSGQSAFGVGAQPATMVPGAFVPGALPGSDPDATSATTFNGFNCIPGTEFYSFSYANNVLRAQYQGVKAVVDVIDLAVTWGGIRPAMAWLPWEELQAYARSYNLGVTSYPFYWSTNGDGENQNVWLFPIPGTAAEMEWDCSCVPLDINSDNDYDALPGTFQQNIPYFAAALCYWSSQRAGQAALMLNTFLEGIGVSRVASDRGKVPDPYWFSSLP